MRFPLVMSLVGVAGCGSILGIDGLTGPGDANSDAAVDSALAVECTAQRVLHLVAGEGALGWFTLAWPDPVVITAFQPMFAYDNPNNTNAVTIEAAHPLFARKIGTRAIWDGRGKNPEPTAFVTGLNETHTLTPQTATLVNNVGLVAAGAAIQSSLHAPIPVLGFVRGQPYGPAPGAPATVVVPDLDGAIAAVTNGGTVTDAQLRPTATQVASYVPSDATALEVSVASQLAFVANAFRLGQIATVIMPAFDDDPHNAFDSGSDVPRANNLAMMLDAFYTDLGSTSETTCGHAGSPLSVADNVVLIVTGDTPRNSFQAMAWPDGTIGNANLMYVRSNGFVRAGWFGQIDTAARTNFDPTTGVLDAQVAAATSTEAAFAGTLYAIARGNKATVQSVTNAPFDGVIRAAGAD